MSKVRVEAKGQGHRPVYVPDYKIRMTQKWLTVGRGKGGLLLGVLWHIWWHTMKTHVFCASTHIVTYKSFKEATEAHFFAQELSSLTPQVFSSHLPVPPNSKFVSQT